MTDLLDKDPAVDGEDTAPSPFDEETPVAETTGRCQCTYKHESTGGRCLNRFPPGSSPKRMYCSDCPKGAHRRAAKSDTPPSGITVNVSAGKGPKLSSAEKKVEEAALAWLMLAATLLAMNDPTCAEAVKSSAPQVATQIAVLSKYHPVIARVLNPVEASGEVLAWITLVVAVSPIILTVLAHHKLLDEKWTERLGVGVAVVGAMAGPPQVVTDE